MAKAVFLSSIVTLFLLVRVKCGVLYPRNSVIRELVSLDGLWDFSLPSANSYAIVTNVDDEDIELMPVPSSYNDVSTNSKVRDHVGSVRYHRKFVVPKAWKTNKKVWLRFGSVCYAAEAYINGKFAVQHQIGHLPFAAEVTDLLVYSDYNNITVLVSNILTNTTVPQGDVETLNSGRIKQDYTFDFFNYAGIDRPVVIYTTSQTYIDDITITTSIDGTSANVNYNVTVEGNDIYTFLVTIIDKEGNEVATSNEFLIGTINIPTANLWWPYLMHDKPGYLYTLKVDIFDGENELLDRYEQLFGIRELTWDDTSFKINGKPLYLRGFGRHEDSDIRGKGLDLPLIIRDHNLIKWIGANSYRTSHYPYAEEIMDLADSLGIMIIDESPAVNTEDFNDGLLENHKKSLTELVTRDKNRPSVIMWSAANEPRTKVNESEPYYKEVISHLKSLDTTRPVTVVNNVEAEDDHSGQFLDILSFNKYCAWYEDGGDLDTIIPTLTEIAEAWHKKHNKPVLLTEYGADTLEGLHYLEIGDRFLLLWASSVRCIRRRYIPPPKHNYYVLNIYRARWKVIHFCREVRNRDAKRRDEVYLDTVPTYIWSEEFQTDLMSRHFEALDGLRDQGWFIGQMIWNFADFKTAQTYTRVGGNKKGIFTRQRQPKSSAHLLRRRYWSLAHALDEVTLPADLDNYIIKKLTKDEL